MQPMAEEKCGMEYLAKHGHNSCANIENVSFFFFCDIPICIPDLTCLCICSLIKANLY